MFELFILNCIPLIGAAFLGTLSQLKKDNLFLIVFSEKAFSFLLTVLPFLISIYL
jgi:hypothetical protein